MTTKRDPDELIRSFLNEGRTELPDRAYDAVRMQVDRTHQRVVLGPWRTPRMTSIVRVAMGAAAVVLATVVGANLVPAGDQVAAPGATSTPRPTAEASPQRLPMNGNVEPGTYRGSVWVPTDEAMKEPTFAVDVPAGWSTYEGAISKQAGEPPTGAFFRVWLLDRVRLYREPCNTSVGLTDPVPPLVDELANAFASFDERVVSPPGSVTIGGHSGKVLELRVPDDITFADCYGLEYRSWVQGATDIRYHQGPGQHDRLWILDVDGQRMVIDAAYFPDTPPETVDELIAMVESIRFDP